MSESTQPGSSAELQARMDTGLEALLGRLDRYTNEQMLSLVDDAGWNIRDHLTHLAAWADGVAALLKREDRWAAMGVPGADSGDTQPDLEEVNARVAAQHQALSPAEARAWLIASHGRLVAAMQTLSYEDLFAPYERFVPPFTGEGGAQVIRYIIGDSYEHYAEHLPWIESIVS